MKKTYTEYETVHRIWTTLINRVLVLLTTVADRVGFECIFDQARDVYFSAYWLTPAPNVGTNACTP
jgi:hypothetical protein